MNSKLVSAWILLLVASVSLSGVFMVGGEPATGSFTFTVSGYSVTGILTDATIAHGGAVQMLMTIDQSISTSYGAAQVTGTGIWSGETNFQVVSGEIGNVAGKIQVCAVFYCQNAAFTGSGTWSGTLLASPGVGPQGSGTFGGMLNISGLPTANGPVPISGNWTATFET